MESIKNEKDQEIFGLREQVQRLTVQLNKGHSAFAEFKEKKNAEIANKAETIKQLSQQVSKVILSFL